MIADDGSVDECIKKMEKEEEGLKKVECLRGRLIAERAASKLAKQEAHQMECKVGELENQLKSEIKSRKRADKKLDFLIKKLNSLNIPYFPEDLEMSDMSSVLSAVTQVEEKDQKTLAKTHKNWENEGLEKKSKCGTGCKEIEKGQTGCKEIEDYVSQISTYSQSSVEPTGVEPCQNCNNANFDDQSSSRLSSSDQKNDIGGEKREQRQDESQSRTIEEDISNVKKVNCGESNKTNPKIEDQSSSADAVEEKKEIKREKKEAEDDYVDESLALVLVDLPKEPPQRGIDPLILDENVKKVLDALSHAKQSLLFSMERRQMIRVNSK